MVEFHCPERFTGESASGHVPMRTTSYDNKANMTCFSFPLMYRGYLEMVLTLLFSLIIIIIITTTIIMITSRLPYLNASEDPFFSQVLSSTEYRADFVSHLTSSSHGSFCGCSVVIVNLLHKEEVEVQSSKLIEFSGLFSVFFGSPCLYNIKCIMSHHAAIFGIVNFTSLPPSTLWLAAM